MGQISYSREQFIEQEVRVTVWHEIAHHFGWSDEELEERE